jgi:SOS response regulatory protein OraA/RecX
VPAEPDPLEIAARALSHRDRSRAQIAARLDRAGVGEEQRAEALETLERVGYVDDARFATARAASLAARGYGDEAIRHALTVDGLAAGQVAAALEALEPEAARAAAIAARLGRSAKTAAHLARKGFGEEAVEAALGADIAADAPGHV